MFLQHGITIMGGNRKVVAAAGTAEALVASSLPAQYVAITAEQDNTGTIVVGDSNVIAELSTRVGTPLDKGDSATFAIKDLVDVYIDATVAGEGVTYTYLN